MNSGYFPVVRAEKQKRQFAWMPGGRIFSITLLRLLTVATLATGWQAFGAIQVALSPSRPTPQPVGTPVVWWATASDSNAGTFSYRFSVGLGNGVLSMVKDFSAGNSFQWTASQQEGIYQIQVVVRNNNTLELGLSSAWFQITPIVSGNSVAVSPTSNPLVALFSAPSCPAGSSMRVYFQSAGTLFGDFTPWQSCHPPTTMNVYIAGMRANTTYTMVSQVLTGTTTAQGMPQQFTTGSIPSTGFPAMKVLVPAHSGDSLSEKVLLTGVFPRPGYAAAAVATDFWGNIIWYYPKPASELPYLTRPLTGGNMLFLTDGPGTTSDITLIGGVLREIDIAGNTVRETNVSRLREQIVGLGGMPSYCGPTSIVGVECILGRFTHEAIRLPNGNTAVLGTTEKIFPAGVQGTTSPTDIIGASITVLDANWQVIWYWDAFNYLNVNRKATLSETCVNGTVGCLPVVLASSGNDWLHPNSLYYIPSEGNLLLSFRSQDWVVKIDYRDAAGTGNIIWRLGKDGDFAMTGTSDPYPWFSHQHDVAFELGGTSLLSLFDNGNTRIYQNPGETSRGQSLNVDQNKMQVSLAVNADLGVFSVAFGSAQRLQNGNYHFLAGDIIMSGFAFNRSIEILPDNSVGFNLQSANSAYRSFRMPTLYTPPN